MATQNVVFPDHWSVFSFSLNFRNKYHPGSAEAADKARRMIYSALPQYIKTEDDAERWLLTYWPVTD